MSSWKYKINTELKCLLYSKTYGTEDVLQLSKNLNTCEKFLKKEENGPSMDFKNKKHTKRKQIK